MTVRRSELAEIYLRILIGYCPNFEREGRPCGLCQEACDALGYEVHPAGTIALIHPKGPRDDPWPRFVEHGPLLEELRDRVGHALSEEQKAQAES